MNLLVPLVFIHGVDRDNGSTWNFSVFSQIRKAVGQGERIIHTAALVDLRQKVLVSIKDWWMNKWRAICNHWTRLLDWITGLNYWMTFDFKKIPLAIW